jgi:hypothetical protein
LDHLDHLHELKGTLKLEYVTGACRLALEERERCRAHDDEIVVPGNLPRKSAAALTMATSLRWNAPAKSRTSLKSCCAPADPRAPT